MTEYGSTISDLIFDEAQFHRALVDAYVAAGLSKLNGDGEAVMDMQALKDRTYAAVTSRVVTGRAEMSTKSWTQGELYAKVFPEGPGSSPRQILADLSPLELKVREKLMRTVWGETQPKRTGAIQLRLGKEGRTEVLIRAKVQRGVDEIIGVFITDDTDLILHESVQPMVEKLFSAAHEVRLHNELVIEARHPELSGQLTRILDVAKKRVVAELARTSVNGSSPALAAASSNEESSEA